MQSQIKIKIRDLIYVTNWTILSWMSKNWFFYFFQSLIFLSDVPNENPSFTVIKLEWGSAHTISL